MGVKQSRITLATALCPRCEERGLYNAVAWLRGDPDADTVTFKANDARVIGSAIEIQCRRCRTVAPWSLPDLQQALLAASRRRGVVTYSGHSPRVISWRAMASVQPIDGMPWNVRELEKAMEAAGLIPPGSRLLVGPPVRGVVVSDAQ